MKICERLECHDIITLNTKKYIQSFSLIINWTWKTSNQTLYCEDAESQRNK